MQCQKIKAPRHYTRVILTRAASPPHEGAQVERWSHEPTMAKLMSSSSDFRDAMPWQSGEMECAWGHRIHQILPSMWDHAWGHHVWPQQRSYDLSTQRVFSCCHESIKCGSRLLPGCPGGVRASFVMVTRAVITLRTCPALWKLWETSKAKGFWLQSSPRSNCCSQARPLASHDMEVVAPHPLPPPHDHETALWQKKCLPSSTISVR